MLLLSGSTEISWSLSLAGAFVLSFDSSFLTSCFVLLFQSALARGKHEVPIYAYFVEVFDFLVGPSGLEPPTSCLSGTRSNLLSYDPMWYSRTWCEQKKHNSSMVEMMGFDSRANYALSHSRIWQPFRLSFNTAPTSNPAIRGTLT